MKPIDPAELSAYLDNELDAERAREIDNALAVDATLRKQYDDLLRSNASWKTAADAAAFAPTITPDITSNITLESNRSWIDSPAVAVIGVCLLIVLRLAPKFSDTMTWALTLHAIGLSIAVAWITRIAREPQ